MAQKPTFVKNYELIEHTADFGIRIRGKDLKELFRNAALAMFDCIASRINPPNRTVCARITQVAEDAEELFVNWLNELLSLSAAKEIIFTDFKINRISEKLIQAEATGEPATDFKANIEIKAATYHQIKVRKVESGWEAEVIFDV